MHDHGPPASEEARWARWATIVTLLLEFRPDSVIDAGWRLLPHGDTLRALGANPSIQRPLIHLDRAAAEAHLGFILTRWDEAVLVVTGAGTARGSVAAGIPERDTLAARPAVAEGDVTEYVAVGPSARAVLTRLQQIALVTAIRRGRGAAE